MSVGNRHHFVADIDIEREQTETRISALLYIKKSIIPSSLAPTVILGGRQVTFEVTEDKKLPLSPPSMTPIHAIRDRLLQGLDQEYNVILSLFSHHQFRSAQSAPTNLLENNLNAKKKCSENKA